MKEMIWATECAARHHNRYPSAALSVSLRQDKSHSVRVIQITLSPDTISKANIAPDDRLDVGFDGATMRIALRITERGPCKLTGSAKTGRRSLSLVVRPEWRLKAEFTQSVDVCAIELCKQGYLQARLPQSWSLAFV